MPKQLFAKVNGSTQDIVLERVTPNAPWTLSGRAADLVRTGNSEFSVLLDGRSHRVLVVKNDKENGLVRLRIGGLTYNVKLEDEQSRLMKTLGLEKAALKVREIKAPMPGLVLNILVKPGDNVQKNDPLLVLEAMKMENMIRAPGDAVIGAISAVQGRAVEKGQLLVSFV